MFHALHKVDMHLCYTKQKINLAYPKLQLKSVAAHLSCISEINILVAISDFDKYNYVLLNLITFN